MVVSRISYFGPNWSFVIERGEIKETYYASQAKQSGKSRQEAYKVKVLWWIILKFVYSNNTSRKKKKGFTYLRQIIAILSTGSADTLNPSSLITTGGAFLISIPFLEYNFQENVGHKSAPRTQLEGVRPRHPCRRKSLSPRSPGFSSSSWGIPPAFQRIRPRLHFP